MYALSRTGGTRTAAQEARAQPHMVIASVLVILVVKRNQANRLNFLCYISDTQ